MPNGERIEISHEDGSKTIIRRSVEQRTTFAPYSSDEIMVERSVHRLPRSKDVIPGVLSKKRKKELGSQPARSGKKKQEGALRMEVRLRQIAQFESLDQSQMNGRIESSIADIQGELKGIAKVTPDGESVMNQIQEGLQ